MKSLPSTTSSQTPSGLLRTPAKPGLARFLALGLALAGGACAATQPPGPGDGSGDGSGSGSGSGSGTGTKTLDATGKYAVQSQFDIATNMPGTVGDVVNTIIDATDSPDDPTKWILDQIIGQMPSGFLKSALQTAEPFVAGYLNDRLTQVAPQFVNTMIALGADFGDMAKHFGLNETLDVSKATQDYSSTVTAVGVHFNVNNVQTDLAFADYQIQNVAANNVGVQIDATGKLTIAQHQLPISYGKVLHLGMDAVIIPTLDPAATNLAELFADNVDCAAVGQDISDAVGIGDPATWQAACSAGLQFGANAIYAKINGIDASALQFAVTGTAKAVDTTNSGKVGAIQTGKWTGTLSYGGGTPAPLATATFTGSRQ